MKAIIVAGGKGERLRPLTNDRPKPMIDVHGKPILEHLIGLLKAYGIRDFIIALCYLPDVVTRYFGDGSRFGITITYTFEDPAQPLGTAGAILPAKKYIDETFIVTYADILRKLDIAVMIAQHRKKSADATINVYKREGEQPKSMVSFDHEKRITQFIERPRKEDIKGDFVWANGSFYIFEPSIFNFIPSRGASDFAHDIFPKLIGTKKELYAYPTTDYFVDIGTMENLRRAKETLDSF